MSAASSVPIGPRKRSTVGMSLPICDTPFAYMLRGMRSVACVTEEHEFFGLPSNVVTLESMSMTCRFRFWRPVSVLKGAKAASACPRV